MNTNMLWAIPALLGVVVLAWLVLRRRPVDRGSAVPRAVPPAAPPAELPAPPAAAPPVPPAADPHSVAAQHQAATEALRQARRRAAAEAAQLEAQRQAQQLADQQAHELALRQAQQQARELAEQQARDRAQAQAQARQQAEALAQRRAQQQAEQRALEQARLKAQQRAHDEAQHQAEVQAQALQRSQAHAREAAAAVPARTPASARPPGPPTVLVVDDSKVVRIKTGRVLETLGLRVLVADDGLSALQTLEAELPDLVITDVEMPGLDGFELTRRLRSQPRWAGLPVIMITSSDDKHRAEAARAGVSVLLGKPYAEAALLAQVQQLLALPAGAARLVLH